MQGKALRTREIPVFVLHKPRLSSAKNANADVRRVLQALGLLDGLGEIADITRDSVGQALASAELPKRVRLKRTSGPTNHG